MSSARRRTAIALVTGLLAVPLGACSDDRGDVCTSANDYVWYLNYLGGEFGGPPEPGALGDIIDTLAELSGDLEGQVPDEHGEEAETASETWSTARDQFADADLSTDAGTDEALQELNAALEPSEDSNNRFVGWLVDECGSGSDWPSEPADALN